MDNYKHYFLFCKDKEGHDVNFFFDTEEEMRWTAENNKAVTPYQMLEVGTVRELRLER